MHPIDILISEAHTYWYFLIIHILGVHLMFLSKSIMTHRFINFIFLGYLIAPFFIYPWQLALMLILIEAKVVVLSMLIYSINFIKGSLK